MEAIGADLRLLLGPRNHVSVGVEQPVQRVEPARQRLVLSWTGRTGEPAPAMIVAVDRLLGDELLQERDGLRGAARQFRHRRRRAAGPAVPACRLVRVEPKTDAAAVAAAGIEA